MKRNFKKFVAIFMALSVILSIGIPLAASDYDHVLSGYGSSSGTDLNSATWALIVTPYFASSEGSMINGYTGHVYCGVIAGQVWADSEANNYNVLTRYGDGSWAEIWFHDVVAPPVHITDTVDEKFSGYGSRSGSTSQVNWALDVTSYHASSGGYVSAGYTGNVYCGVVVDYNWYDSDALNSNSINVWGDGSYTEIWMR